MPTGERKLTRQPPDDDYLSMAVLPLTLDGHLAGILALYARETDSSTRGDLLIEMAGTFRLQWIT